VRPPRPGFGFTDEHDWVGPKREPIQRDAELPALPTAEEREALSGQSPASRPAPRPVPGRAPRPIVGRGPRPGGPAQWRPPLTAVPAPPRPDLIGEDEEIVAGRHPVEEAFIARREAHRLLVVPQRRQALEKLVLHATNLRIPIVEVEGGTLTSLAGFDGHQGIALVTDRRRFHGLDAILARAIERGEPPFVLVLDSLEDPQNFGSLLRTAEASGVHGVIYPTHRQAPLSAAAVKSSAGAVEHLLLAPVEDLAEALADLHVRGLRIVGTDAEAPLTARETDLRGPAAIVVGSEGQGLGPAVRRRCDALIRIPMRGRVSSLNASVAGSILLYEAATQRGDRAGVPAGRAPVSEPDVATSDASDEVPVETVAAVVDSAAAVESAAVVESAPAETPAPAKVRRPRKSAAVARSVKVATEPAAPSGDAAELADEPLLPGGPVSTKASPDSPEQL
jgi:23S rRNA (guanosine2251-2'-O)-methyltransferase